MRSTAHMLLAAINRNCAVCEAFGAVFSERLHKLVNLLLKLNRLLLTKPQSGDNHSVIENN